MAEQRLATPAASTGIAWDAVQVGDALPPLALPAVDRTTLALYAGASNDHNPIHIDIDAARRSGLDDVIAHGMLSMAWLGRLLTQWVDPRQLREFEVRFAGITRLGDRITCSATVADKFNEAGEARVRLTLQTCNQDGEVRLTGRAVLAPMTPTTQEMP